MLNTNLICLCDKNHNNTILNICENTEYDINMMTDIWQTSGYSTTTKKITDIINKNDDFEKQLYTLLDHAKLYGETSFDNNTLTIDIEGDWKHDHGRLDFLMDKVFNLKCQMKTITKDTQSDWYGAMHYYQLP